MLAHVRSSAEASQARLHLMHPIQRTANELAVCRQINQKSDPANGLSISRRQPSLGSSAAPENKRIVQDASMLLLPLFEDAKGFDRFVERNGYLAIDLGSGNPLAQQLIDVADQIVAVLEAAYRFDVPSVQGFIFRVGAHFQHRRLESGIQERSVSGAGIQIQGLASRGPISLGFELRGGIHQPDMGLSGPSKPPCFHKQMLMVQPLVVEN